MGLTQKSDRNFVKIADGQFFLSSDKEKTTPYRSLEKVVITGLRLKTENFKVNGKEEAIEKLYVDVRDEVEDKNYSIALNFDSSYSTTLLGFLANADLSKPVDLSPSLKKDGDKESRTLFVRQDGEALRSGTSKDSGNPSPMMKKVKIGKKEMWDKTDFLEFYRELVGKFNEILAGKPAQKQVEVETVDENEEESNDLPF